MTDRPTATEIDRAIELIEAAPESTDRENGATPDQIDAAWRLLRAAGHVLVRETRACHLEMDVMIDMVDAMTRLNPNRPKPT